MSGFLQALLLIFGGIEVLNTQLAVKEVSFNGDIILAAQDSDKQIWVAVRWICNGLGMSQGQMQNERVRIHKDLVLQQGERNLVLPTKGDEQDVLCILIDFLPLWLAKISITPKMKETNPRLVEKLIAYQLKAKDVLANAFLPHLAQQTQSANPLLEQAIMSLQQSQQNLINCVMEQGYQLDNHEKQLEAINESVTNIEKSLEHDFIYADRWDEVQNEFYHLNRIVDDLRNELRNQSNNTASNISLDGCNLVRSIIKPLGEKLHDSSLGYKSTYRRVYKVMDVGWKYRATKYQNQHQLKTPPKKIVLVQRDKKLLALFEQTIEKMLQEN